MENAGMERYLGQMLDGRYKISEVIGRGGMAWVFKAHDHLLNRDVAIKILRDDMAADSEFRLHFKKEAQAVAKLSHTNIVSVHDVSRIPGMDYIVMELIDGITLKQYMKTKGHLSCRESAHFAMQIAKALSHAHSKGIIHRDIKPQNIMIDMEGRIKVADFGIAYLESSLGENRNVAVGSVHYISPEQARGKPADARSDIYSLGVVLYEMLSGQVPFTGDDPDEITKQHLGGVPTPLRKLNAEIPPMVEAIVSKAMATDINRRYQSADEMLQDLERYLSTPDDTALVQKETSRAIAKSKQERMSPRPLSRSGELSRESYERRYRRSTKVSMMSGFLLVMLCSVGVFVFLWNYWLRDIFADPVKISIPNFVGSDYKDITENEELAKIYNFRVHKVTSTDVETDVIIAQTPESGKSRTLDSSGIDMELTVSTGVQMIPVPDVTNMRYTDAITALQRAGFVPDYTFAVDDEVTADYVLATNPEAGDQIPVGSTVYITVSSGPELLTLEMPDLTGMTRAEAKEKIDSVKLTLGNVTYVQSNKTAGTVIWQSVDPGVEISEHTKIFLQISSGPYGAEVPTKTETPSQTTTPTTEPPNASITPVPPTIGN